MADNHPAKIAKYLLKGWCLLNEYCPNGQNIPLVKSREGTMVCAGCDSSCPYYATHGEPQASGTGAAAAPVPAALAPHLVAMPISGGDAAAHSASVQPTLPSLSSTPLRVGGTPASVGSAEVTLQAPESRFCCVRLDYRVGGIPRLLGETYVAKVRVNLVAPGSSPDVAHALQEAFTTDACRRLSDRVLIPASCPGADISFALGQVTITRSDGTQLSVPEKECVFLPGVTPELIAKYLLEALLCREDLVSTLNSSGVRWLEVCLCGSGGEVTYRRAMRGAEIGSAAALALANDW